MDEVLPLPVADRERCLKSELGTLRFEVLGPRDGDGRVLFYEVYNDDAAFQGALGRAVRSSGAGRDEGHDHQALRNTVQSPKVMKHMNLSFFRRSLYAMRETSQRPDRCAVVPLMGSRAVGSTVRL